MATIEYIDNGKYYEVSYRGKWYGCDTLEQAQRLCFRLEHKVLGLFANKLSLDIIKRRNYSYY